MDGHWSGEGGLPHLALPLTSGCGKCWYFFSVGVFLLESLSPSLRVWGSAFDFLGLSLWRFASVCFLALASILVSAPPFQSVFIFYQYFRGSWGPRGQLSALLSVFQPLLHIRNTWGVDNTHDKNSKYLFGAYPMLGTVILMLTHLILTMPLWDRYYYYPHFTDEKTET